MKFKSKILVIAGSDSSGGAGIQADIKTITSLGSYAMTAITAITSQNTTGVLSISKVPINEIKRQIEFTSKDIRPDAIKIGMLHSKKVIETVINSLKKIKVKKIILDPVMVAKGGTKLVDDKSIEIIKTKLMNRVSLITPNIPEAEILAEKKNLALNEIGHEDLKRIVPKISPEVMKNLDLRNSVNSKKSYGGTSFENIKKMIRKHKKEIK